MKLTRPTGKIFFRPAQAVCEALLLAGLWWNFTVQGTAAENATNAPEKIPVESQKTSPEIATTPTEALTSSSGKNFSPSPASPSPGLSPAALGVLPEVLSTTASAKTNANTNSIANTLARANPGTNGVTATNDVDAGDAAPELGKLVLPDAMKPVELTVNPTNMLAEYQMKLELAKSLRIQKNLPEATQILANLLTSPAPDEIKRPALFEMALVAQDDNKLLKAEQVFAQYLQTYPNDPSSPEILLRQGLIYRQMGIMTLAISKFYAVMSTALNLKLDNIDYYKRLVLQAQIEIADSYYMEGKYEESADYFARLLKIGSGQLNKAQIQYKLIRSLSFMTNNIETVAKAQSFLDLNSTAREIPEVRYILAATLKKMGRNQEAMRQVLLLLRSQQENVSKNPELYIYWQQRAGNDIANQLYKDGDYLNALQIYLTLAELDKSAAWQMPVWYQSALVYEQLQQAAKAREMYDRIIARQKDLTEATGSPSLTSIYDMAKWRIEYLDWTQKAKVANQAYLAPTNLSQALPTGNP